MDLHERMAALDARIAARASALNQRRPADVGAVPAPATSATGQGAVAGHDDATGDKAFSPVDGVTDAAGLTRLSGFSFGKLFSEVFRHHSDEETEDYFSGGYPSTTPQPETLSGSWPAPWIFTRCLFAALLVYAALDFGVGKFGNLNLIPGMVVIGSFAVPVATLLFFMEMNVWRNVSLFQTLRVFFFGGVLSLLLVLFGFDSSLGRWLDNSMGASCAGVIEEIGKLAALAFLARSSRYDRLLNGLLLGAAVGAGFAAFESSGYAFCALLSSGDAALSACRYNIILRGVLSPFGHVVWTAMAGAALWRAKNGGRIAASSFFKWKFLRLFSVPVLMHMLWNSDWNPPYMLKYLLIGIIDWIVVLAIVQEGLEEVRAVCCEGARTVRSADLVAKGSTKVFGSMLAGVFAFCAVIALTGFIFALGWQLCARLFACIN